MLANWKPEKGTRRKELLAKRASLRTREKQAKAVVMDRDGRMCRVPGCKNVKLGGWAPNVAHLEHKGMGGDRTLDRTQVHKMLVLCFPHHLGEWSLDKGTLRIEPDTSAGTNGPCQFWMSDVQKQWQSLGVG